ncbi:MAG: methylated-DNA--[protein]-cysteine S-methyltransferase [Vicinamibacteria bacterium]
MDCLTFDDVQLASLVGDASDERQEQARQHGLECEACRLDGERDRRLDGVFRAHRQESEKGFSTAHRKLEKEFRERHALYGHVEGPFGPVYIAATARGLCRVSFRTSDEKFASQLFNRGLLPEREEGRLREERNELSEYLAGRRKRFELPLDFRLVTPFQRKVLSATSRIPFGQCMSYSDIARRIGQPEARRAVGGALSKNPIAIVVPCHRVIAADGSIGDYTGGLAIKRALFRIEDIDIDRRDARGGQRG